jgi:hypothetical protein
MKLTTTTWRVTMADLEAWKAKLVPFLNAYRQKPYPNLPAVDIEFDIGPKYARVWHTEPGAGRYAYAFVDMTTGDLLKPATWKAPAKHARGNLFAENPLGGCGPHGMAYLR